MSREGHPELGRTSSYDGVAAFYDAYVTTETDLEFLREEVRRAEGAVLELMAGTGRVTRAIVGDASRLVCLDRSLPMLRHLVHKILPRGALPLPVCGDARFLPFGGETFGMAFVPFNSFSEILSAGDRARAISEIGRCLRPAGRFLCTVHNPTVRASTLDGHERFQGRYELEEPRRTLELWVRGTLDRRTAIARSEQRFRVVDRDGARVQEFEQLVHFALIEPDALFHAMERGGFRILDVWGDYDRSRFRPDRSPFVIALGEKG